MVSMWILDLTTLISRVSDGSRVRLTNLRYTDILFCRIRTAIQKCNAHVSACSNGTNATDCSDDVIGPLNICCFDCLPSPSSSIDICDILFKLLTFFKSFCFSISRSPIGIFPSLRLANSNRYPVAPALQSRAELESARGVMAGPFRECRKPRSTVRSRLPKLTRPV